MTTIATATHVDPAALDRFLVDRFNRQKAEFLRKHGEWWHRGQENRWVVEEDGEVIAYCAVIPTSVLVGGDPIEAAWWVDLVVAEPHRGRGLETLLDEKIRSVAPLILGFPNALAAKIHRKHDWGVREDLDVRMLPLNPGKIAASKSADGLRGSMLRFGARVAEPFAWFLRRRVSTFAPRESRIVEMPDACVMAQVFAEHHPHDCVTTLRDESYLLWRYLDSPYRDQLVFIFGGNVDAPRVVLVLRVIGCDLPVEARILDLFGDIRDKALVDDVIHLAVRCALDRGAAQVTALASEREQSANFRAAHFVFRSQSRLCWLSSTAVQMSGVEASRHHVVLGDSDNDEP